MKKHIVLFATIVVAILLATGTAQAQSVAAPTETIVPYLDTGYKYKVVGLTKPVGWYQPTFDDSSFSTGDAGFGSIDPNPNDPCFLNSPLNNTIGTSWPPDTDILVRKNFVLPKSTSNLKVGVAIDNDVQVFINGQDISGGVRVHEFCAERDSFVFLAPDSVLHAGGTNTLAVLGIDRGGVSYLDLKVTADVNTASEPCTIIGTKGRDTLRGTMHDDVICAKGGSDAVEGRGGDDVLWGGKGQDAIEGGKGADKLYGEEDVDALDATDGVRGNDVINGGGNLDACRGDRGDTKRNCP